MVSEQTLAAMWTASKQVEKCMIQMRKMINTYKAGMIAGVVFTDEQRAALESQYADLKSELQTIYGTFP